ncbi:GNAT family N-acetyltransferase [Leifsonia aquatica]|uniref:GNAT family N-acetyltransferase n=1 Tax=Leifsonia aquatica TaxID=144185 RepID=UPI003805F14A
MADRLRSERFDPAIHDVSSFACGEPALDTWLRDHAADAGRRHTAATWVWVADGEVVGYYALSAHKVARAEVPGSIGRGGPREIPAVLIGKLALAERLRGRGLGDLLLADALTRVLAATQHVAARVVVVDALVENVARFYERLGFVRVPGSLVLVQRVRDVRAALAPDAE